MSQDGYTFDGYDLSQIKTPEELPFDVPDYVAEDIIAFIDAMRRDDPATIDYLHQVYGSASFCSREKEEWLRNYYCRDGWKREQTD